MFHRETHHSFGELKQVFESYSHYHNNERVNRKINNQSLVELRKETQ
ncbi:IS3 family transposase [Enterococcus durans]